MALNPYFGNPLDSADSRPSIDYGSDITSSMEDPENQILTEEEKQARRKKRKEIIGTILAGGLYGANALVSYQNQVNQNLDYKKTMMDRYQQDPIYDYNNMYGPNTMGGSEFQPIIKAEKGALVRGGISKSARFKIDDGEMIMLPDGKLEKAKGNPSVTDGVSTVLPKGTKVYSNTLKPKDSKYTFAEIAGKLDYTDHLNVLENPYSSQPAKRSAELMLQRKKKGLDDLFLEQQILNDFSEGEVSEFKKGGKICYECGGEVRFEEGGVYDLDEKEVEKLKKLGYKIEII